jgi:hypothetical protein
MQSGKSVDKRYGPEIQHELGRLMISSSRGIHGLLRFGLASAC